MDLSNDLISKFVKITNDDKNKNSESTVYGTVVEYNGGMYVRIDGSDLLTPVETTADFKPNERVTVMIKNHSATVTGNITSPSTNEEAVTEKVTKAVEDVEGKVITEVEILIADRVSTEQLDAEVARIDELVAGKASVEDLTATNAEITNLKADKASVEDLTATNAEITNLKAEDAKIENLLAGKASIKDLTATNAEITNLKAKDAEIENLVADKARIEDLTATNARIDSLQANKADITYLDANFATIDELEAAHADIEILDAEVANINTLVNGNLTSDNILSLNITSQNTTMENAFVKDAMIDTVTANKIMSGTIDTNKVTIQSTDGSMLLQGTLLQMKDDNGKVRIQIGKDTGGNFTFVLYDESGTGVLIDEEGIKSSDAIADGLIVDAKVADNANIAGSKLDIASVITEVNNDNSTTIKSNKIYLDEQGQSLEVAFNSLKTHVDTIQDVTIDGDLTEVIEQVQSNTTQIAANKEGISTLVSENTSRKEEIRNLDGEIESVNNTLSSKYSSLEQDISGFKTTVADTYTTKSEFNGLQIGGVNLILWSECIELDASDHGNNNNSIIENNTVKITPMNDGNAYNYAVYTSETRLQGETYTLSFDILTPDDIGFYWYPSESYVEYDKIKASSKWQTVSFTYTQSGETTANPALFGFHWLAAGHVYYYRRLKLEKGNKPTAWSPAPEDVQGQIDATNDNLQNNYSTTSAMNSAIQQKANEITSTVSQTYTTKSEFNNLQIGGRNLATLSNIQGYAGGDLSNNQYYSVEGTKIIAKNQPLDSWLIGFKIYTDNTFEYVVSGYTDVSLVHLYFRCYDKNNTIIQDQTYHSKAVVDGKFILSFNNIPKDTHYFHIGIGDVYTSNYFIDKLKIEKGNKATDWSPAPEDVQGQIDATNNNLSANYSTTSAMNSAIQQKANEITSSVSQTYTTKSEFNNLQIGGKNLLLNSKREITNNNYCIDAFSPTELFEVGEQYTVSICVTPANGVDSIKPFISGGYMGLSNPLYVNGATKQVVSVTFNFGGYASDRVPVDASDSNASVQFYRFPNDGTVTSNTTLHWVKIEKGAKATDWSPAPEDVQGQIDATNNNLSVNYSTTSAMNSAIQQKANEITSTVSETYATKAEFNNLEIGGTNLLPKSGNFKDNCGLWITNGSTMTLETVVTYNGHNTIKIHNDSSEGIIYNEYITLKPNTTYTYSITAVGAGIVNAGNSTPLHMWVYPQGNPGNYHHEEIIDWSHTGIGTKWGRSYIVFKTPDVDDFCLMKPFIFQTEGQIIYVANFKVEEGNRPTDWSPAPEDVQGQIDATNDNLQNNYSTTSAMNSAIQQKANEITSTVSQTYTTKSEFNNLQIGGTNTFKISKVGSETWDINYNSIITGNSENGFNVSTADGRMHMRLFHTIKDNGYWTVSFKVKTSVYVGPIIIDICDLGVSSFNSDTNWSEVTRTVLVDNYSLDPYNFVDIEQHVSCGQPIEYYFKDVKVEKGNKATAWSPAPEDIQGQIDATNNNLQNNYSTTSAMNSAIQQKANEITSSVSETYATKQSVTDISNNLANNYSTTSAMNSAIQQKANEITSSVSQTYISNYEAKKLADTTTTGLNKYLFERYQRDGYNYPERPTLNDLVGARLIESQLVDYPPSATSDLGSNYIGVLTFYLYYDYACTKTVQIMTDDHGTVYLNNVAIYDLTTCLMADVTFNMVKGLNRIDIIYAEGNGQDGVSWGGVDGFSAFGAYANVVANEIANRTNELTLAMTQGNMLYTDPTFRNGDNGSFVYNNNGNGTVTKERIVAIEGCPNTSGYCLKITTNGEAVPGLGGFAFGTGTRYNAVYITKITAKIPVGYRIGWASNAYGDNGEQKWLSTTEGTGDWHDYYCKVKCGNSGDLSSTNFFYLLGPQSATAENPVTWYVSYATVFDVTDSDERITNLTNNLAVNYSTTSQMNSAIQQKANEITSTVSQTYATKSEFNNLQIGGTNLIQNGNFKGAIAGSTSMPNPWTFWSDEIHIYGSHGLPGYNHVGCIYIGCNLTDGRQAGMFSNDIHVSKVEKGANYMASFIFAIETNVKHAIAQLEYINDARDQILYTQVLTSARVPNNVVNGLNEHQYHIPFTMWTGDFSYVRIVFNHGGTNVVAGGYLMIVGNVQIEKGNKATDWSPAPEDVQGQIDATNNNLATNYSTTSQMNSAIQQKANEITSSVSQTYTTKAETTAVQNQIATSRNLLMGSRDYNLGKWSQAGATVQDEWYNGTRIYTTTGAWANMDYLVSDLIDRGVIELFTPYTFSCYVMSTGSDYTPHIDFYGDGLPNYHGAYCGTASTSWQRISITIEWSSFDNRSYPIRFEASTPSPSGSYLKWACFQLERGRVATGWAPAPEDAQYGINDVYNNLVNNYSTTSAMNSAIQQKANEITSSVSQTYATKAEFNNLEVGGTNLIYNGGFNRNLDGWHNNGGTHSTQVCAESPSGYMLLMEVASQGQGIYQVFSFPDDTYCTDYVVSFYAKTNVDGSQMYVMMEGDPGIYGVFTLNGGWQKCVYKFRRSNTGSNALVFYAQGNGARNIYIHSIKAEKGTVPSAWSPHPNEIEHKIDNLSNILSTNYSTTSQMNSAIQQKANEITSSVSQTYATKQSVTDVSNNLANNYSTTSQMNTAIQQKANEITSSVAQTYITKSETSLINDTVAGYQKWLFEMYTNNQYVGTGSGTYPTLAHLANETLISSRLVDYLPGYTSAIGDYYIGVYTVYLYYESAYTWNGYIISDDESTTYLNGVAVCQAASCTQTTFTMNFKKGVNKLQIIHGEGGGGDGVTLSDLGPWKEYGAYPACVTAASTNHYASNSDIVQTANDLTIKFTESGGYNLLQNGHADKGTSYWKDNGGGLNYHANAGGGATGNFFGTSFPHGISYYDWVKLLPNTHYVYQAKIWTNVSFVGNSSVPLHYWFSYDCVNITGDGYTILDYQQNVSYTGTWTQCYIHFVTGNNNIYFKPFIYTGGTEIAIYVTELMLSQSRVVQPWSPHPSEVYSGITQIDKDGIKVQHSNANGYTHMSPDGFFINRNGADVLSATSNGLYVQGNITSGSTIQGARITGSTFNSSNDVFQVLEDGTIETSFLAVNGAVSTDKLNVNDIENASYPKVLSEATTVYISPNGGVNAEEFYDGAYFTSLSNMLAVAPRNLNGYTLTIRLAGDLYENAALTWFHSGQVNFELQGHTLYGYFYGYGASMCYRLYGNTNANNNGTWGHIKPNVGRAMGSYYYAVQFQYCQFAVNYIAVYPSASSGSSSGGIGVHRGATGIIFNAKACGDMRYLVRAEYAGRVHVNSTQGACNNATFCASTGGIITLNSSNSQAGRSTTGNPYWVGSGGLILCDQLLGMEKITFNNTAQSGSSSSSGSTTRTVTETVKASSADTYRSTVYNNWKGDGTVRQGDYGYGDCQGCWFFGNNLYNTMNAGTVTKVVIRMKRQSGGVNALQTLTVKSHNHTSRPSGAPTYTNTIGTCSCAVGSYIDLVITDSATINKLKTCKGLGLSIGSASSPYAVCSGACSVIITYTTNS